MSVKDYQKDVHSMFDWLGQLAYELDTLEAQRNGQAKKSVLNSVQSASVSSGNGPKSNASGSANGSGPVAAPMGLKIEIPVIAASYDLNALQQQRTREGTDKLSGHGVLPVRYRMWTRTPHSNSRSWEVRRWGNMSHDEQRMTRRALAR